MTTTNRPSPAKASQNAAAQDIDISEAKVDKLHLNAIGLPGVLYFCLAGAAPISSMLFNVPSMASQAGAATPLVFLLCGIGLLMLGVSIVYLARRLSSAGGFYTWVRHSLGRGPAFQTGWLMVGGYALFEAAMLCAFGSYTNNSLVSYLHFNIFGGWATYALIGALLVFLLSYFDVRWSVYATAPFLLLEVGVLIVLDIAITLHGGSSGHDLVHTFSAAGADLKGAAPGGVLGIGIAMALGVWSWIGFETGASYGEEAKNPRRAVPFGIFATVALLLFLFVWTSYSATIGYGWQHAVDQLGNLTGNPTPYYPLADKYVPGGILKALMIVGISTSALTCALAFHNSMVRYLYAMGREHILGKAFGKTHARYKSPYIAIIAQSLITVVILLLFAFLTQKTGSDGTVSYRFGLPDASYTQTDGINPYNWLATVGTIAFLIVYVLTNISAPVYALRFDRKSFNVFSHIIAPIISTLMLLIPAISFIMPAIPGPIGNYFTNLGFAATPFPLNILPLFTAAWVVIGIVYAIYLARAHPERYEAMGRIIRS